MFKKIIYAFLLFGVITTYSNPAYAESDESSYTELRTVDNGTFNEYRYKITDEFFNLRNKYEIDGSISINSATLILNLAKNGYKYLPDSLSNKNYYNYLKTSIERGLKYPENTSNYSSIVTAIENYLEKTNIKSIKGTVEAYPKTGNAPLMVTLRGKVSDPTGTSIPKYNYTWWMYEDGKKKILGDNISLTHLFKEEGSFSIWLDVTSAHKNKAGYTDVLSFSSRADIVIKEKVASLIIKINSTSLRNKDELKFTPDEARYGLLFDATSSTPTQGAKFINTRWDFGNGVTREYNGDPKVERVIYAKEGEYSVTLKLQTNELKQIERKFIVSVRDPIATIKVGQDSGFLGDKFTFSAQNSGNDKDLSYAWEIIDLKEDKIIFRKAGNLFTYSFKKKGKYNVKMKVTEPSGETDVDTKIIYINSRAPTADFISSIPLSNKPNKVYFDATKSFDPDFSDDGKLKYTWIINGNRVNLDESNYNGSTGYFTFDSVGNHSVVLEVEDPDNISSQKKAKVNVSSILSVEFFAFPRVAQRGNTIRLVSSSPEAKFYEWDFGDGTNKGGKDANISHKYSESGIFNVKLKVRDVNDQINTFSKNVYIGDSDNPYSFISVKDTSKNDIAFDEAACEGKGAYLVNRVDSVTFSGRESINITGKNPGLTYSWKLGKEAYKNSAEFTKKFDELGCYPVKLTVKSNDNGKTHKTTTYVQVKNLKPILSSLDVRVLDDATDPVIVNLSALGAKDLDGVIQSYLWYYYTDIDSEPQDFRATKSPSTSFVLPKVTGNYYFVVVMKDNNEDRSNSEEITGSKYFMTLTGDNLNTPLVRLKVNDSSVSIGDEVIFTVNVENILGQDLSKKVKYSWDFDGDGFYDKETTTNVVTYKYDSSGEKYVKVKAKYKGFSNTRSLKIGVSNILKPKFGYISIGNKFMFFDNSMGTSESYEWDLGDGTIIKNKKTFNYEYNDGKAVHIVSLKISEGTKVKSIKQKVIKNVRNRIFARKNGLVIFSSPLISKNQEIILEDKSEKVFIYLGSSKPDIANYVIDYDINYDSDLNGGNEDDEDNKKLDSYTGSGEVIEVELNEKKFQTIRLFIKDSSGVVVESKDIAIIKNYIEEKTIDINSIIFAGVSDSTKLKIEKLKEKINDLPKEFKLKALMYVQKLQEEWSDNREKTNVILEFEGFIYDINIDNTDDIINLLESLLVENQEDKSEKAITFNALKNLIPISVECIDIDSGTTLKCYDSMVLKLEAIRDNENIEENKILGSEILKVIADDKVMTNKEKTDFKAILKTLVYGGVGNIPDIEKEEIINGETTESSGFMKLLTTIFKWLFIILLGFTGIVLLYYIYYLVVNKDKNIGFQDFIIEKTSGVKKIKKEESFNIEDDVLSELNEVKEIETNVKEVKKEDIKIETNIKEVKKEENISETKIDNKKIEEVPDWLKGSFENDAKSEIKKVETKKDEKTEIISDEEIEKITKLEEPTKKVDDEVPDWLKGSFEEDTKNETKKDEKREIISDKEIEKITKLEEPTKKVDDNIPDWLKGSFEEDTKSETKKDEKTEIINDEEIEKITKLEEPTKKVDDNIPDWLKGSFEEDTKNETKKVENTKDKKIENKTEKNKQVEKNTIEQKEEDKKEIKKEKQSEKKVIKKESKEVNTDINLNKQKQENTHKQKQKQKNIHKQKQENINKTKPVNNLKQEDNKVKEEDNKVKEDTLNINNNKKVRTKSDAKKQDNIQNDKKLKKDKTPELWDDGMKVPDWLKSEDEK